MIDDLKLFQQYETNINHDKFLFLIQLFYSFRNAISS